MGTWYSILAKPSRVAGGGRLPAKVAPATLAPLYLPLIRCFHCIQCDSTVSHPSGNNPDRTPVKGAGGRDRGAEGEREEVRSRRDT